MAREDFIPSQDDGYLAWHDNFKTAVLANASTFGLVAGDTSPITADNTDVHAKITALSAAKSAQQAATNAKNMSRAASEARIRALVKRIKAHPAYTPVFGAALGIIGPDSAIDIHTSIPEIKGRDLGAGQVEIQFKKSVSSGISIYSKRGTETVFTFLATDTESPYIDTRPLLDPIKPELRTYRVKFRKNDEEVGNFSEELVVNCAP